MRLVQLLRPSGPCVAIVDEDRLRILDRCTSVYELALLCFSRNTSLRDTVLQLSTSQAVPYEPIYNPESRDRILPPLTHPEPARCLVSGTGLTHKRSAENRAAMHSAGGQMTDSERMYVSGLEGGRPAPGTTGTAPEWFYKGCGTTVIGHGDPLTVPPFGLDGGEEPEIAGAYIIDPEGHPRRIGMMIGNEFSDHVLEKENYLYLAHSKLRPCAIGPELVVDPDFSNVRGTVSIERKGQVIWSRTITSGEANMAHSLANLEHHHFKYEAHRRPGDVHIHFFGADAFSFGAGLRLEDGDVMEVAFEGFGRPLRNPFRMSRDEQSRVQALPV